MPQVLIRVDAAMSDELASAFPQLKTRRHGESTTLKLETTDSYGFVRPGQTAHVVVPLTICAPNGPVVARLTAEGELRGRPAPRRAGW